MKKFIALAIAVLAVSAFITSCLPDEEPYPSAQQLNGVFGHSDQNGYTAIMIINSPSAYFASFTPTKQLDCEVDGAFIYKQETGSGIIHSTSPGAPIVDVESFRGMSDLLNAIAYREMGVDTTIYIRGGFGRLYPRKFVLGTWTDTDEYSQTKGSKLTITSLLGSKCGTLVIQTSPTTADTADITGVTDFYMLSTSDAIGAFSYRMRGEATEKMATGFYESQATTLSFVSMDDENLSIDFNKFTLLQ